MRWVVAERLVDQVQVDVVEAEPLERPLERSAGLPNGPLLVEDIEMQPGHPDPRFPDAVGPHAAAIGAV